MSGNRHREDSGPSIPVTISSVARSWVRSWRSGGSWRSLASHEVHKEHNEILYATCSLWPVGEKNLDPSSNDARRPGAPIPAVVHTRRSCYGVVSVLYRRPS